MNLDKRVTELERRINPDEGLLVWILSFVGAKDGKPVERNPVAFTTSEGLRWDRLPGESLEAFRERATREVPRSPRNIAVLREEHAET
jgi:hypothetical protein